MKFSFILLASLGLSFYAYSQEKVLTIKPLNVGDKVPDIQFSMVNYPSKTVKLSNFANKLVILDFWATWCTGCLHSFPKMDSLQQQYSDKLQVLLVNTKSTGDDEQKIKGLFNRLQPKNKQPYNLPSTLKDTIADKLFRHKTLPHYVWLFNGKVKAFTSSEQVTSKNIEAVLTGQPVAFRMKIDDYDYNNKEPLFLNGNGGNGSNILYRSMITGYSDGLLVTSSKSETNDKLVTRFTMINSPIIRLYQKAYQKSVIKSRLLLEVKDAAKLVNNGDWDSWKYDNTYCYEIITPAISMDKMYQKMQSDLVNFFGYTAAIEKRKVKCFVLRFNGIKNAIAIAERKPSNNFGKKESVTYMHNQKVATLTDYLDELLSIPVLDESNYNLPVDIEFNIDMKDTKSLQQTLKTYGFDLIETEREMEMFVLKEEDKNVF